MDDLSDKVRNLQKKVMDLEVFCMDLEDRLDGEKAGRMRDKKDLEDRLDGEKVGRMRHKKELSKLEGKVTKWEMDNKIAVEKLTKLEWKFTKWETDKKNAMVRQFAFDLEWRIKMFLIEKMDPPQRSDYFYGDDDSLIRFRVDEMEYREVVHYDRRLRLLLLQEYFEGDPMRYSTFTKTMSKIKDIFNPVVYPMEDFGENLINKEFILQYIEDSTLAEEHKTAAKEYALWQYPD